jgi:hypothetical protein
MDISPECWLWSNFSSEFLDLENTERSLWFEVCMWTGIKSPCMYKYMRGIQSR